MSIMSLIKFWMVVKKSKLSHFLFVESIACHTAFCFTFCGKNLCSNLFQISDTIGKCDPKQCYTCDKSYKYTFALVTLSHTSYSEWLKV